MEKVPRGIRKKLLKKHGFVSAGAAAFAVSFIFQLLLNRYVTMVRSLPDEMGAVYLAARASGCDWSYVMSHCNRYYGSVMFPLLYPWFRLIKSPYVLYQFLLGTGAFLRSLPALYASDLMRFRYGERDSLQVFLVSLACVFVTPMRAVNIDNEPALIFLCWTVFYILMLLLQEGVRTGTAPAEKWAASEKRPFSGKDSVSDLRRKQLSVLLAAVLALSLLAHTRAAIFAIVVALVLLACRLGSGRWMVHIPWFGGSFAVFAIASAALTRHWKETLYHASSRAAEGAHLANTGESLVSDALRGAGKSSGAFGFQSLLDLLCGNIYVIFVFSGGVIVAAMFYTLALAFRRAADCRRGGEALRTDDALYPLLFGFLGIAGILAGICLTWIGKAINLHAEGAAVSRGHFYLRYYGMFFGPFFFSAAMSLAKERKLLHRSRIPAFTFAAAALFGTFSFVFSRLSFLPASIEKAKQSDSFYNFAPLSFSFKPYPLQAQDGGYYLRSFLAALILFCALFMLAAKRKRRAVCLLFLVLLLYQYSYCVVYWDHPITSMNHFAASSDGLYALREAHPELFPDGETLYQLDNSVARYTAQFTLRELKIVNEAPPEDAENVMVLMEDANRAAEYGLDTDSYRMLVVDENEILLIRGREIEERFARAGLELGAFADPDEAEE